MSMVRALRARATSLSPKDHQANPGYLAHYRCITQTHTVAEEGQTLGLKLIQDSGVTLAGVAQWIDHRPMNPKVTGSIPGQGPCLGCGPGPQLVVCKMQLVDVSLSFSLPPLSLKINK